MFIIVDVRVSALTDPATLSQSNDASKVGVPLLAITMCHGMYEVPSHYKTLDRFLLLGPQKLQKYYYIATKHVRSAPQKEDFAYRHIRIARRRPGITSRHARQNMTAKLQSCQVSHRL
jgi:hypothetical protein